MAEEFRIVRGVPTDEELAAIVGVLLMRAAPEPTSEAEPSSAWVTSARPGFAYPDGRPSRPGSSGWRASALPR
jgi:Acyl-CoA carboxylase epsilon subunit